MPGGWQGVLPRPAPPVTVVVLTAAVPVTIWAPISAGSRSIPCELIAFPPASRHRLLCGRGWPALGYWDATITFPGAEPDGVEGAEVVPVAPEAEVATVFGGGIGAAVPPDPLFPTLELGGDGTMEPAGCMPSTETWLV